jgi:hypothetical protein
MRSFPARRLSFDELARRLGALLDERVQLVEHRRRLAVERLSLVAEHRQLLRDIAVTRATRTSRPPTTGRAAGAALPRRSGRRVRPQPEE